MSPDLELGDHQCAQDRHVRTVKEPVQPIPLFEELVELLMEVGQL